MKIKKLNIVKRAVPVLISAIAVSALYTSHSFAGTNTIPWSDVMLGDSLSIGAGYYEDDTVIQIPTKQQVIERHEINIDDLVEYDDTLEGISSLTASYYSSGNNDTLGVGITSSSGSKDVALSTTGASDLNLGINESITLPSGYYANPITIKNGVANRGSTLKALALAYLADNNTEIRDGIYLDYKDAIDSAYAKGVTDGKTGSETKEVDVIYHINHTHGSYCYPTAEPVFVNDKSETKSEYDSDRGTHYNNYGYTAWYKCSVCGATYSATRSTTHKWDFDDGLKSQARTDAYNKVRNNHLVNGTYCPASGYQCGKEDGEQDITDGSVLGAGDTVVSATIKY